MTEKWFGLVRAGKKTLARWGGENGKRPLIFATEIEAKKFIHKEKKLWDDLDWRHETYGGRKSERPPELEIVELKITWTKKPK